MMNLMNESVAVMNNLVEKLETMKHEQIMKELMIMVSDVASKTVPVADITGLTKKQQIKLESIEKLQRDILKQDRLEIRMLVIDILASLEYSSEFIESVDSRIEAHFMNPVNKLPVGLKPGYMVTASSSTESVVVRSGVLLKRQYSDPRENDIYPEFKVIGDVEWNSEDGEFIVELLSANRSGKCKIRLTDNNGRVFIKLVDESELSINRRPISSIIDFQSATSEQYGTIFDRPFYHTKYGLMNVISETTDEYGNQIYMALPMKDFEYNLGGAYFMESLDLVGQMSKCLPSNIKPMSFMPCELIDPDTLCKGLVEAIKNSKDLPEYQAFYSPDFTTASYMKDDNGKALRGTFEPAEATEPLASCLEENVKILMNLPRVKGESPKVLALGVDSGRIFTTSAGWLYQLAIPETVEVVVPKYTPIKEYKLKNAPKKAYDFEKIERSFVKTSENKVTLKPTEKKNHRLYWDLAVTKKDLRYKYQDPKTAEVVTEEVIIIDNGTDIEASLVTATPVKASARKGSSSKTYGYIQDTNKSSEKIVKEILSLGIAAVEFAPVNNKLKVTAEVATGKVFDFIVTKMNGKMTVVADFAMTEKANNAFCKLASVVLK